jgi:putative glutamine amidotransferase
MSKPAEAGALRPVLGIIACNRIVANEPAQSVMTRYLAAALPHADAAALIVPAMPGLVHAREVAARIDGILLTGSPSNVSTQRYGPLVEDAPGPFDPERDEMTERLIDAMLDAGKPVFGICRGFQEINVAFGGSLRRDVSTNAELIAHHADEHSDLGIMFEHVHRVDLTPGGLMHRAYNEPSLDVISVHYQGVDKLGDGLVVEATAPDGLIEAVSADVNGAPVLAVQWHPEWNAAENPQSQTFFKMLGRALRREALAP